MAQALRRSGASVGVDRLILATRETQSGKTESDKSERGGLGTFAGDAVFLGFGAARLKSTELSLVSCKPPKRRKSAHRLTPLGSSRQAWARHSKVMGTRRLRNPGPCAQGPMAYSPTKEYARGRQPSVH